MPARDRCAALNDVSVADVDVDLLVLTRGEAGQLALAMTEREGVLRDWSHSRDAWARALVAFNPHTPHDCVEELARDDDAIVRVNAAMNPHLSRATRVAIARHDPALEVREFTWSAMSTVSGRAVLQGARYGDAGDGTGPEPGAEYHFVAIDAADLGVQG